MLLFYLVIYMISGLCVWSMSFLRLKRKIWSKHNKELGDLALLKNSNKGLGLCFSLMFSIAGIPPMIGFLAKAGIFFISGWYLLLFGCFNKYCFQCCFNFFYIRVIKVLYFENLLVGKLYHPIDTKKPVVLSVLIFSLIFYLYTRQLCTLPITKRFCRCFNSSAQFRFITKESL
jgi:NADH:ubiquinone oxidoreductase subunit 2 (subunit N)